MASAVCGIGLSSVWSLELRSRKSTQNRMDPSFLLTSTTREPQAELDLRMMPRDSISSMCFSTISRPASPRRDAAWR